MERKWFILKICCLIEYLVSKMLLSIVFFLLVVCFLFYVCCLLFRLSVLFFVCCFSSVLCLLSVRISIEQNVCHRFPLLKFPRLPPSSIEDRAKKLKLFSVCFLLSFCCLFSSARLPPYSIEDRQKKIG